MRQRTVAPKIRRHTITLPMRTSINFTIGKLQCIIASHWSTFLYDVIFFGDTLRCLNFHYSDAVNI